jgi:L-2-hydroxyglutarate oxidase LhgO
MAYLEHEAQQQGAMIAYNCEVVGLEKDDSFTIEIKDSDGQTLFVQAPVVINAAGLEADKIAALAGIDLEAADYRIYPCKGEYFRVSDRHRGLMKHLVYPVPTRIHSGTHTVLSLDDRVKIGPNAFYVDSLDYDVDAGNRYEAFDGVRAFLPFIEVEDLSPDMSGIRPKLYRDGEPFRDFVIQEEGDRNLTGLINLIGLESPGLTSCLAIAELVETML